MKIGIDARLYSLAGPGRYIANLIKELEKLDSDNEYIIFVSKKGSEEYSPKNKNFKKWVVSSNPYSFSEQLRLPLEFIRADLDLLHVPHFNIPILYPGKMIVTVHDLIMHNYNPRSSQRDTGSYTVKQLLYKLVINIAALRATKIIVPSEKTKEDLISKVKAAKEEKVIVTYEGVDDRLTQYKNKDDRVVKTRLEEMRIRKKYLLFVGSAYPHKNLDTLIVSFKDLLETGRADAQLVIAGKVDDFSQRTAGFVHALKMDSFILFAAKYTDKNVVTDQDLAYLYMGAHAYVFPSLEEGFSITPLEAQAFGVPILLSDIPTHREVFRDSVLYFDPKSSIDLSNKLEIIINDTELRDRLAKAGVSNVARFSWQMMGKKTKEIYLTS